MPNTLSNTQIRTAETHNALLCNRTTTSGRLAAIDTPIIEVFVQADPGNGANVMIGNATNQFVVLTPGSNITIPIDRLHKVHVVLGAGDRVNWIAGVGG